MKASFYNLFVPLEDGGQAIFNTLSGGLLQAKSLDAEKLQSGSLAAFSAAQLQLLVDQGMVVADDFDERAIYKLRRAQAQFDGTKTHIFLTLTRACNCKCGYCFQSAKSKKGILSPETARDVRHFAQNMVEANRSRELQIDFFGGEPLLCLKLLKSECLEYETYAAEKGLKLSYRFYTNGTLLTEDTVEWLKQRPIKDMQITLDGPEEIHNSLRPLAKRGANSFQQTIDGLKRLRASGIPFVIRINFDRTNKLYIDQLLDVLVSNGLSGSAVAFFPIQNMTEASCGYHTACTDAEIREILPALWKSADAKGFYFSDIPAIGSLYCTASTVSSAVIDMHGDVYKCALLQEDAKFKVGKISDDGFSGPTGEYYNWMKRDPLSWRKCADCILLPMCGGGCGGAGQQKNGSYHEPNCMFVDENLLREAIRMRIKGMQPS